jgi:hypothetical protein
LDFFVVLEICRRRCLFSLSVIVFVIVVFVALFVEVIVVVIVVVVKK